jgi:hypothetical protein
MMTGRSVLLTSSVAVCILAVIGHPVVGVHSDTREELAITGVSGRSRVVLEQVYADAVAGSESAKARDENVLVLLELGGPNALHSLLSDKYLGVISLRVLKSNSDIARALLPAICMELALLGNATSLETANEMVARQSKFVGLRDAIVSLTTSAGMPVANLPAAGGTSEREVLGWCRDRLDKYAALPETACEARVWCEYVSQLLKCRMRE